MIIPFNQTITITTTLTMPHEHCWHDDGAALLTDPPQLQQTCCWCGEQRTVRLYTTTAGRHGPYLSK